MEYEAVIQTALDEIDKKIKHNIKADELARAANYSTFHFYRLFLNVTGIAVMNYVTRRKLEYALYDLSHGAKIMDVALEYGFETHAGFTKAFKKCYGAPPSLYRLRVPVKPPGNATAAAIKNQLGGIKMQVNIREIQPFAIVGVVSRHSLPNVKKSGDIPAYWNTISLDYGKHLARLYHAFTPAVHGEYGLCFDVDEASGEFTYMLGVAFDKGADEAKIEPDMQKINISGGLYAVFTTPLAPDDQYPKSITDTWVEILTRWLPGSQYEYDEARLDFEAYDERDHAELHDNMVQMDIYLPVRESVR